MFVPDIRTVHAKDLNFILRSKIYVHWDGQLRASHLILGVEPVYSTWQNFKQALLIDSPPAVIHRRPVRKLLAAETYNREGEGVWTALHLLGRASPFVRRVHGMGVSAP